MNQTQKDFVKFWTKLLLIVASGIALTIGMFMGNEIALTIVAILCVLFFLWVLTIWTAQRIYLWRIMGILTPEEWNVAKWYRYSLLENGPNYIITKLSEESTPNEWHISIFERIANQVEIPKILLDKSAEA